ncbi:MAG: nucleoid-associated protein [Bacteroidales bacterium]|jgi:hypothetical protein|nr:nucleoid-associated protein [Bacteroidales bacterium]
MQNTEIGKIEKLIIHFVGNKNNGDGVRFSDNLSDFTKTEGDILYLINNSFKSDELFQFYFIPNLELNPIYQFVTSIFQDNNTFVEQSKNCARLLYDSSTHPKIKGGEFYTVYFKDCIIDGETVDAVGLFKSENKDTFLKVYPSGDNFEIESEKGININKLDKGCLIFNTEKENGYVVAVVDNTNKGVEAQYWIGDFLHVRQRKDEYYNTQNIISLTKNFVKSELPQQFEVSGADQADLMNKTVKFFKEKDNFNLSEFANEVIGQPEVIEKFNQYKSTFAKEYDVDFADDFTISESAVKKQARTLKSVIKLDKNFHIYVHGDHNLIEQGKDEKGKYYKVYFKEEN